MSWVKGQSGNPAGGGRPKKGQRWADAINAVLKEKTMVDGKRVTYKDLVARKLVMESIKGDVAAAKLLMERVEGKPYQAIDVTTGGQKLQYPPMQIVTTSTIAEAAVNQISSGIEPKEPDDADEDD